MPIGFPVTKNQHASGHESESEERADVGEVGESSDVEKAGGDADEETGHPGGEIWTAITRVDTTEDAGGKALARHGEPHAGVAELEDQGSNEQTHTPAAEYETP